MKRDAGLKAVFLEKDCFRRSEFPYHWLSAIQKRKEELLSYILKFEPTQYVGLSRSVS